MAMLMIIQTYTALKVLDGLCGLRGLGELGKSLIIPGIG